MSGKAPEAIERARVILGALTFGDLAARPEIYGLPLRAIPKTCFSFMSYLHVRWAEQAGWRPALDRDLLNYGSTEGDKRQLVEEWVARSVQTVAETPSGPPDGDHEGGSSSVGEPLTQGRGGRGRRRGPRRHNRRGVAGGAGSAGT